MKQLFLIATVLFTTAFFAQAQDVMVVNDKNAQVRNVSGSFSGIKVSNAIDVIIKQGNDEAVVVSATEEKYRDRIKTEVKDGVLRIWYDNDGVKWGWNKDNKKLRAYISVKNLSRLDVSGACDVKIDGILKGDQLKVLLSGASSLKGEVVYNKMSVDQSGASDSDIKGSVSDIQIQSSGASDFKGINLVSETCNAEASGASDISITVNKELKVSASGASDVTYRGSAVISSMKSGGASSVRKRS
jgi:Putative auto-transporter adhesin, head GIN domain